MNEKPDGLFPEFATDPFKAPHCDSDVLHAPGECEFCDHYSKRQAQRVADGINFTGHRDASKKPCPSEERRPLELIERWGGNVAAQGGTLKPHSEPPETLAWWMYGDRAEPAHSEPTVEPLPPADQLGLGPNEPTQCEVGHFHKTDPTNALYHTHGIIGAGVHGHPGITDGPQPLDLTGEMELDAKSREVSTSISGDTRRLEDNLRRAGAALKEYFGPQLTADGPPFDHYVTLHDAEVELPPVYRLGPFALVVYVDELKATVNRFLDRIAMWF